MLLEAQRELIVAYGKKLLAHGLTTGTGGNLSCLDPQSGLVAISPSGIDYEVMEAGDVVVVDLSGAVKEGSRKASSELAMHLALYARRDDFRAVIHTHSIFATTLSCLECALPAVHYLVGFAGREVKCAPYATFGTTGLARSAVETLGDAKAVLLAHHGLLAAGADIAEAFKIAELVEYCAEVYWRAKSIGSPDVIPDTEMDVVIEKFSTYGRQ